MNKQIDLSGYTQQECFDIMGKGWRGQNYECSLSGEGMNERCAYRGKNNMRCPVGWLIKEEEYIPELEGLGIRALVEDKKLVVAGDNYDLLREMQTLHDSSENKPIEEIETDILHIAATFQLDCSWVYR